MEWGSLKERKLNSLPFLEILQRLVFRSSMKRETFVEKFIVKMNCGESKVDKEIGIFPASIPLEILISSISMNLKKLSR